MPRSSPEATRPRGLSSSHATEPLVNPRFADFFYTAVSTAFISPPGDIVAHSRGARAATMIEMLTAFALVTVYAGSFFEVRRAQAPSAE